MSSFRALSKHAAPFSSSFCYGCDWSNAAQGSPGNRMSVFQTAGCQSGDRAESHWGNSLYCRTKEHHFIIHLVYTTGARQWHEVARREVCVLRSLFMGHVSSYCCGAGRQQSFFFLFHNKQEVKLDERKQALHEMDFLPNLGRDSFYSIDYDYCWRKRGREETFKVGAFLMLLAPLIWKGGTA